MSENKSVRMPYRVAGAGCVVAGILSGSYCMSQMLAQQTAEGLIACGLGATGSGFTGAGLWLAFECAARSPKDDPKGSVINQLKKMKSSFVPVAGFAAFAGIALAYGSSDILETKTEESHYSAPALER